MAMRFSYRACGELQFISVNIPDVRPRYEYGTSEMQIKIVTVTPGHPVLFLFLSALILVSFHVPVLKKSRTNI
jgi:hypothetical protein